MGKIVRAMMNLIASEVCGRELNKPQCMLTDEEMTKLYSLSKSHDLAHLAGDALIKSGLIENNTLKAEFKKQIMLAFFRSEKISYESDRMKKALSEAQIPFMPLKGAVIRKYYPEPWMRTSCDIDILVREKDSEAAQEVLTGNCGYTDHGKGPHDVSLFSPSKIHVELHYGLVEEGRANAASKVLENIWDAAVLREKSAYLYEMPDEYFYFYHIAHMAKHFVGTGGCGIRPFIDLWILNNRTDFDREKRDKLLSDGGLAVFAKQAELLAEIWFGDAGHTEITKQMEEYILRGGVYGTDINRIAVQQQQKGGRIKYALSKIFIPYDVIRFHYPILQKHRWLTPVMEVRRWGKLIFCGHLKRTVNEMRYNNGISKDEAQSTREFLDALGLYEK